MRTLADVPLSTLTTLRLGGPARRLVEAGSADEIVQAVKACDDAGEPLMVLGGGSNLVISDEGFAGTVLLVRSKGIDVGEDGEAGTLVRVAAGEDWDVLVAHTVEQGLAGMEALSGIPGSTGATPIQNVGAYGQDVSETVAEVEVYDRVERTRRTFPGSDCGFSYRHSRFKGTDRFVVLAVTFRLQRSELGMPVKYGELARALGVAVGERAPLHHVRETVLRLRAGKGMVLDAVDHDTWSAGSFFTNPILDLVQAENLPADAPRFADGAGRVKTSAAWLIEHAGFGKGYGLERPAARVSLSTKHTLALTNRGGAATAELIALAREVRDGVRAKFGVELVNEPVLVGETL